MVTIVCLVLKQRNGRDYKPLATDDPDVEQSIKVGKMKSKVRKINGRVTKLGADRTCQIQINSESTNHNTSYKNACNDCDQGCTGGEGWAVCCYGFVFSIALHFQFNWMYWNFESKIFFFSFQRFLELNSLFDQTKPT